MAWHFSSGAPVYLQVVSRIRADILNGVYSAEEQIPSVRQLAFEAGVNPNTMQKAFAVLEEEHLFVTRGTVGRFITTDTAVLAKARETLRRETALRCVADGRAVGMEPAELIRYILACTQEPEFSDPQDTKGGSQP